MHWPYQPRQMTFMQALIGSTGFVGGVLGRAHAYDLAVHRSNIEILRGRAVDRIVCAGLPAAKWLANRDPAADLANMEALQATLRTVQARSFVLISTVDVYPEPQGCDESWELGNAANHAYGRHRLRFEAFVRDHFPQATILRLPALFGPGLKKNVLFDLLHDNCLESIQPASSFQWYPLVRLPADMARCEATERKLVNLCPEPLATRDILGHLFPGKQVGSQAGPAVHYDVRTQHAAALGGAGNYVLPRAQVLESMRHFVRAAA